MFWHRIYVAQKVTEPDNGCVQKISTFETVQFYAVITSR